MSMRNFHNKTIKKQNESKTFNRRSYLENKKHDPFKGYLVCIKLSVYKIT